MGVMALGRYGVCTGGGGGGRGTPRPVTSSRSACLGHGGERPVRNLELSWAVCHWLISSLPGAHRDVSKQPAEAWREGEPWDAVSARTLGQRTENLQQD